MNGEPEKTPEFPTLDEQVEHWRKEDRELNRAEVDPDKNHCLSCDRGFKSAQALRMHVARVHTKTILAVGQKKESAAEAPRKKWSLARRRRFNAKKAALQGGHVTSWSPVKMKEPKVTAVLKYCPNCGEALDKWRK